MELIPSTELEFYAACGRTSQPSEVIYKPARFRPINESELIDRYQYISLSGSLSYEVLRFERHERKSDITDKVFFSRTYNAHKKCWSWGLRKWDLTLYRAQKVEKSINNNEPVFVVEGEKDVHELEKHGITSTCNPLGALQWQEKYSRMMSGAVVIVIADNDRIGKAHASQAMSSLRSYSRSVNLLTLPGNLSHKEDVSSWIRKSGNSIRSIKKLVKELL